MLTKELFEIINLHDENRKRMNKMREQNILFQKLMKKSCPEEKYLQGKIYKLSVEGYHEGNYIGSTTKSLNERLSKHKSHYKQFKKRMQYYISSFELYKYAELNNATVRIELLEIYPCRDKFELEQREGWHMDNYEGKLLNSKRAGINDKKHVTVIHKKIDCECGGKYTSQHKSRHEDSYIHLNYLKSKIT